MEEMYIKTVPIIGIAKNYGKEISSLNERLYYSIISMYELTPIERLHAIYSQDKCIRVTNMNCVIRGFKIDDKDKIVYLGLLEEAFNIIDLPIEAKYQLVKLLDSENG